MAKDEKKVVEEVAEVTPEAKPEKKPMKNRKSDVDKFILRKLKALNQMGDKRKAKELADRVMRNSRKGK